MKTLYVLTILCCNLAFSALSQTPYRTQIFTPNIKTLQVGIENEKYAIPVIEMNSGKNITIQFDEMSHDYHSYGYTIKHCDADWTLSDLISNEYISGYTTGNITDSELSQTTTFLYTHYTFSVPNDDMDFKISGNYIVFIYEDNQTDKPIAQACFSIVDPKINISAKIRSNTDTEINGRYQQIDFDINLNGYNVRDVNSELKVIVQQNNRFDNEAENLKPSYINGNTLSYINNRNLIFEGGNEYHSFDISSVYTASNGVDQIKYVQPHYEVFLTPDKIQQSKTYISNFDVNGRFLINYQEATDNSNIEGDYMYVHFLLPVTQPFFDGQLYLGGNLNYNLCDSNSRLDYDFSKNMYYKTLLLKQGGYNYQYWFVPKGTTKASVEKVDGSYWQTGNEYSIYVYHRGPGDRYDKLIGVNSFQ